MAAHETHKKKALALPIAAARPSDITRLSAELESIDNVLLQTKLKSGAEDKLPKISHLMERTLDANDLDILKPTDRATLKKFLDEVVSQAPVFHISFSTDPPAPFMEKLMSWFRREIHPSLLLTVGLQPDIGAGCVLRTTNKQFDFSLRQDFENKQGLLMKQIAELTSPAPYVAPAAKTPSAGPPAKESA